MLGSFLFCNAPFFPFRQTYNIEKRFANLFTKKLNKNFILLEIRQINFYYCE